MNPIKACVFSLPLLLLPALLWAVSDAELVDQRVRAIFAELEKIPGLQAQLNLDRNTAKAQSIFLENPLACINSNYLLLVNKENPCLNDRANPSAPCVRSDHPAWAARAADQGYPSYNGNILFYLPSHSDSDESMMLAYGQQKSGNMDAAMALLGIQALNRMLPKIGSVGGQEIPTFAQDLKEILGACRDPKAKAILIEKYSPKSNSGRQQRSEGGALIPKIQAT